MKKILTFFAVLFAVHQLVAQTNAPARLALISETEDTAPIADLLTAQLSSNQNVQLLERDQIEKVYREQALSVANKDYLKLGQILGADGLLLLEMVKVGTNQFLNVRLLAVKPGVVLSAEKFPRSPDGLTEWSATFAKRLNLFLPKLTVLPKDAIPISVVNLRSAIASADAAETERQLKLLTVQRLSQERQYFVLERQKMSLLGDEKDLKADDTAFWNGSYLVEGVVDQNGYSESTITLNARLTPPRGGAPILLVASGSRTNLAEVINQLVAKINGALKINSTTPAWNAADEAAQYFNEANWAMRWGAFPEAQAAADSAWALGKRDLDCALVRVKSYVAEVNATVGKYQSEFAFYDPPGGYDSSGKPRGDFLAERDVQADIKRIVKKHPWGMYFKETHDEAQMAVDIHFMFLDRAPNPKNVDRAIHALELYEEFSRTSPDGQPQIISHEGANKWRNSDWYDLGIENLTVASYVLQNFNAIPESQKNVADKLAELHAMARSVAALIVQSASVHDSYFVGDRIVTHDELARTLQETPNIFRCEVIWGGYWQETPENSVALYRELMSSPVFSYIHADFWLRDPQNPRFVGWNETDRLRLPQVWNSFLAELQSSTNAFWPLEAKALALADADGGKNRDRGFTNFFAALMENHDALVNNNVEVLYLDWGLDGKVNWFESTRVVDSLAGIVWGGLLLTDTPNSRLYDSEYRPKLEAMDQEYWRKKDDQKTASKNASAFEEQKQFLKTSLPFDSEKASLEFDKHFFFGFKNYSKAQALELQPLVAAFHSKLLAQMAALPPRKQGRSKIGLMQITGLETALSNIVNPPAPRPPPVHPPERVATPIAPAPAVPMIYAPTQAPEVPTNIVAVGKFFPIPLAGFMRVAGFETVDDSTAIITAHHWLAGKLLLNFDRLLVSKKNYGGVQGSALATFDPATEQWTVVICPAVTAESQNNFYHRSVLFRGDLFDSDGGQIKKYNAQTQRWEVVAVSDGNNYELFVINEHFYAANKNLIFEILDGGKSSQILASTRRQPPVTTLDLHGLGMPVLFEGPNHSLRVIAGDKIYSWTGNDWREECAAPSVSSAPEIFTDGILYRHAEWSGPPPTLTFFATAATAPELYLWQKSTGLNSMVNFNPLAAPPVPPVWQMPAKWFFAGLAAGICESNLYLLADQPAVSRSTNNTYDSTLLCFSRGAPLPQKIFLKFAAPEGHPPMTGVGPTAQTYFSGPTTTWMLATTNLILLGTEHLRYSPDYGNNQNVRGHQTGVWLLPTAQLAPMIAEQKAAQLAQATAAVADGKQAAKNLFNKFDLNHNGVIDPDERAAALDDPAFIASQLDVIDANHNGQIDLAELTYFDANQNKMLEPKEQAGLEIAQHLLAEKAMQTFDVDGDGLLDQGEFAGLWNAGFKSDSKSFYNASLFYVAYDKNHDQKVDLAELESFLKQLLQQKVQPPGRNAGGFPFQIQSQFHRAEEDRSDFKFDVEAYWKNPDLLTNGPAIHRRVVPNAISSQNRAP